MHGRTNNREGERMATDFSEMGSHDLGKPFLWLTRRLQKNDAKFRGEDVPKGEVDKSCCLIKWNHFAKHKIMNMKYTEDSLINHLVFQKKRNQELYRNIENLSGVVARQRVDNHQKITSLIKQLYMLTMEMKEGKFSKKEGLDNLAFEYEGEPDSPNGKIFGESPISNREFSRNKDLASPISQEQQQPAHLKRHYHSCKSIFNRYSKLNYYSPYDKRYKPKKSFSEGNRLNVAHGSPKEKQGEFSHPSEASPSRDQNMESLHAPYFDGKTINHHIFGKVDAKASKTPYVEKGTEGKASRIKGEFVRFNIEKPYGEDEAKEESFWLSSVEDTNRNFSSLGDKIMEIETKSCQNVSKNLRLMINQTKCRCSKIKHNSAFLLQMNKNIKEKINELHCQKERLIEQILDIYEKNPILKKKKSGPNTLGFDKGDSN